MADLLNHLDVWWVWLILAVIFFVLDLIFAKGYLLAAAGAAVVALIISLIYNKADWYVHDTLFIIILFMFIAGVACYKRWAGRHDNLSHHQRHHRYIGKKLCLDSAIVNGRGTIRFHGITWMIHGEDMPVGMMVKVIAVEGIILKVERLADD